MMMTHWEKFRDKGLLLMRLGVGLIFIFVHGGPKMMAGPGMWEKLGGAMGNLGISFAPTFWGFMAAFAESFGALGIALGLFFRPSAALLAFNMFVALIMHFTKGDTMGTASHAFELLFVFAGMVLVGPGKYSIDEMRSDSRS